MWAPGRWGAGSPPPSSGAAAVLGAGGGGQSPASRSDSTLSLLSPLGHQSCPLDSDDGDAEDGAGAESEAGAEAEVEVAALRGLRFCGSASVVESEDNQEEQKQVHLPESRLTPWEVWFVGKEKEERDRLQQKALEELNQQLEKRKEMEEREKRKAIAEEKHKEWVQKKNKQQRKEREQKINKEMEEKAAKELEKEHLQEKAKEKYQEWLKKKNAQECEKKRKEKEKEKQRQAELQEKKEIAEKKFKEWLENAKNKPRPAAKSYGYANGKLTGTVKKRRFVVTIQSSFWRSEVFDGSHWAGIKALAGLACFPEALGEKSISWSLQPPEATCIPWLATPSVFKKNKQLSLDPRNLRENQTVSTPT